MQKQARDHDVFPSGQLRPETHAERHEADAVAVHVDRAGVGPEDPGDRAQKRRFSRAVFADDADDLPFPYRKVDAAERVKRRPAKERRVPDHLLDRKMPEIPVSDPQILYGDRFCPFHQITFT